MCVGFNALKRNLLNLRCTPCNLCPVVHDNTVNKYIVAQDVRGGRVVPVMLERDLYYTGIRVQYKTGIPHATRPAGVSSSYLSISILPGGTCGNYTRLIESI